MRLSIATKIVLSFCGILFTFSLVMMISIWRTQALFERVQTVNRSVVPLSLMLSDAQNDLKSFASTLEQPRSGPQNTPLQRVLGKLDRAHTLAARTRFDSVEASPVATRLQRTQSRLGALIQGVLALEQGTQNLQNLPPNAPKDTLTKQRQSLERQAKQLETQLSRLRSDLRIATDLSLIELSRTQRTNLYALGAMFLLALVIALTMLTIALLTVRPLRALTLGVQEVAKGTYEEIPKTRAGLLGDDELATLTKEFNAMSRALVERDTTLRHQHDELLKSERLATVGRMTSLITHELRNPLSSIGLNAEMLMDTLLPSQTPQELDPAEARTQLETIINEVDRLHDITQEYLIYARLPEPKFAHKDLIEVIESLIDFHIWEWEQTGVSITFEPPVESLPMRLDANQMRQALLNLVKNAVEALHDSTDKRVELTLTVQPEHVFIRIKDNGHGIPKENWDRVFEPFFTSKSKGTGLGLAMTQQIIQQHQGSLTLESQPPATSGTTFLISLPLHQENTP